MYLSDLKKGKKVILVNAKTGTRTEEKVVEITLKYNYERDIPYRVIELRKNRFFDCDTGKAINPPLEDYIELINKK